MIKDGACAMRTTKRGPRSVPRPPDLATAAKESAAVLNLQGPKPELLWALPAGSHDVETVFPITA
jgi:hypothetical protein